MNTEDEVGSLETIPGECTSDATDATIPIVICWNDGCLVATEQAIKAPMRTGIDLCRDDVDTRPRRVYTEGRFCSDSCALTYILRVRDNPTFYTQALTDHMYRVSGTQSLGSPYIQALYNVCGVHGLSTDEYRRGGGINVACVYSDLLEHANQPEWNTCFPALSPWMVKCCWNESCRKCVAIHEAIHVPTSVLHVAHGVLPMAENKTARGDTPLGKKFAGRGVFCSLDCMQHFLSCVSSTFVDPAYRELARYMIADPGYRCSLQTNEIGR